MTTIVLTIIGILLAAAAALMVVWYGGDAFNGGSVGARANEIMNAGQNVVSAAHLYRATTGVDAGMTSDLTTPGPDGSYLASRPSYSAGGDDYLIGTTNTQGWYSGFFGNYIVFEVRADVCRKINDTMRMKASDRVYPMNFEATQPKYKMGCIERDDVVSNGAAKGQGMFFAKI